MVSLGFLRRIGAALLLFSVLSAPAYAETQLQVAKRLYQAASHHYDLQEFEKALDEFKQAYEAKDDPVFLFNIAQCQRSLGQNEQALRSYKTYLLRAPNAPNRADVDARITTLEAEITAAKAAKPATTTAQTTKPREATKPPETTKTPEATPETSTPPPVVDNAGASTANLAVEQPAPPHKTPVYKKWWLWTTVGVVVVGAGLGVGLGLGLSKKGQPVGQLVTF